MWIGRFFQVMNALIFGLVAAGGFAAYSKNPQGPGAGVMLVSILLGLFVVILIEVQIRSFRKKWERVHADIDTVAQTLFDHPGAVAPGYNVAATLPPAVAALVMFDVQRGFTADGMFRGVHVSCASHVSSAGRQWGEFTHVYSYVKVDVPGVVPLFRVFERRVTSSLFAIFGATDGVPTGDATFDSNFIVQSDASLARDVFASPALRERLVALRARVPPTMQPISPAMMMLILSQYGLAVRWPTNLDPALAAELRDVLLEIRAAIIARA